MIGRLRGLLALKTVEAVLVDVGGVGYEVHCPLTVLERLPPTGSACELSIHTHVREDQITLFGFGDADERALFRALIGVTGVGPKLALACLGGLRADDLVRAIVGEDVRKLSSVPGVGKRTAERIILELRERLARTALPARGPARPPLLDDLESALRNLGYRPKDVDALVAALAQEAEGMTFEALLREALRRLTG